MFCGLAQDGLFGDSLAHSALLGVALGFAVGVAVNLGIIIICSIFAVLTLWLQQKKVLATDTLLGTGTFCFIYRNGYDKCYGATYRPSFHSLWRYSYGYTIRIMVDLYRRDNSNDNASHELVISSSHDIARGPSASRRCTRFIL